MVTKKKKKYSSPKLHEYRIRYNAGAGHSAQDSYHYYQAESAEQALSFHNTMMEKKNLFAQIISVEEKDPYRPTAGVPPKRLDKSEVINHE